MIGKQKVLIVDDDENIAELISLYLIKECYDTRTVGSGEEALQIFDVWQPEHGASGPDAPGHGRLSGLSGDPRQETILLSSCSPPRAKSLTRFWAWKWAPMTT